MSGVHDALARCLGPGSELGVWRSHPSASPVPLAEPADAGEVAELVKLAHRDRLRLAPLGRGTKRGWFPAPERLDFALSTRRLAGVVHYEPGDGTLTARAGTPWRELSDHARAGGHHLSPDLGGSRATLGGAVAAGQGGRDRLRYGPLRHHVLGMAWVGAEGRVLKSGGRLVKNVTGYDLHRLHCGARGSLGVLLEVSLRLYPLPEARRTVRAGFREADAAVDAALRLWRAPLSPETLCIERAAGGADWTLWLVLAGRRAALESEEERSVRLVPHAAGLPDGETEASLQHLAAAPDADGEPQALVTSAPSAALAALRAVAAAADEAGLAGTLICHPGIASTLFTAKDPSPERWRTLARALEPALGALGGSPPPRARWRNTTPDLLHPEAPTGPAGELAARLRRQLDPQGVFAGGPSPPPAPPRD